MTPVLELSDVCAGYGPFRALFGVSLSVERGEALALVGSNGAGKTTVARVASGLLAPSAGAVVVEGRDMTGSRRTITTSSCMAIAIAGHPSRLHRRGMCACQCGCPARRGSAGGLGAGEPTGCRRAAAAAGMI